MGNLIFCMGNPIFCIYVKIEIGEFKYSDDDDPICPTKKLAGFFLAFNNRLLLTVYMLILGIILHSRGYILELAPKEY